MIKKVLIILSVLCFAGLTAYSQSDNRPYNALVKAANQGDSEAQALLAYRLKEGIGVKRDIDEAKRWAQIASESWNGLGFWLLAQMSHEAGDPVSVYRKYLDSAMSCYYPLAWSFFARLYESGSSEFDIEKDEFTAFELFREAANHGDTEAAAQAAGLYLTLKNDPWSAFEYFSKAANNGDADSMFMLASMYFNGMGVTGNRDKALSLLKDSAKSGSIFAKSYLEKAQSMGDGFSMPVKESLDLFMQRPFSSPEMTLKQVSLVYPVPENTSPIEFDEEEDFAQKDVATQESNPEPELVQHESSSPKSTKKKESRSQPDSKKPLHLELDLGLGSQMYYGDNDWKVARFSEMLTLPSIDLNLTLWAFSRIGFGLGFNTAPFKGLYQATPTPGSPSANFRPNQVTYYTNSDSKYASQNLALQAGSFVNFTALAHADLMNICFGVNPGRFFDIDIYAGGGVIYGFAQSGNVYDTSFNAGLTNTFSLSEKMRLLLNIHGALIGDAFDGESYTNEQTATHWSSNRKFDGLFGASLGFSFTLGGE